MGRKTKSAIILILLLLFIAFYLFSRLKALGFWNHASIMHPGVCSCQMKIVGPEDMQIDHSKGILYVSGHDRRKAQRSELTSSNIFYVDLRNSNKIHSFTDLPASFSPHGLSLYRDNHGTTLFVISHRSNDEHTVEVFTIDSLRKAKFVRTVRSERFVSPNDLVAISHHQFYLTNDGKNREKINRQLDALFNLKSGSVVFYSEGKTKIVADKLAFPNGINYDPQKQEIYITETLGGNLRVYAKKQNFDLSLEKTIQLGVGLDNIDIDEQGNLWIARQPNLLKLNAHIEDSNRYSPGQILKIDPETYHWDVIFEDPGQTYSGISVAVSWKNLIYVGSIMEPAIMECEL